MLTFVSHANGLVLRGNRSTAQPMSCTFSHRHWPFFPYSNDRAALPESARSTAQNKRMKRVNCVMQSQAEPQSTNDDDDDEAFGMAPVYGMHMPDLSKEDKEYVDAATSNEDFMQRMTSVARRMEQQRLIHNARTGKQTSDSYIESLAKVKMHRSEIPPKPASTPPTSKPTPSSTIDMGASDDVERDDISDIEAQIARINQDLVNAMTDADLKTGSGIASDIEDDDYSEKQLSKDSAVVDRVQREIREDLAGKEPDYTALRDKSEAIADLDNLDEGGGGADMVNRQIAYLESHLAKLKKDAETDGDAEKMEKQSGSTSSGVVNEADSTTSGDESLEKIRTEALSMIEKVEEHVRMPDFKQGSGSSGSGPSSTSPAADSVSQTQESAGGPRFDGLEDTPGGMSADEKRAAFEALRRQAMEQRQGTAAAAGGNDFADPYNVTLPDKKNRRVTFDDNDFDFDDEGRVDLGSGADSDGDEPSGDEEEYNKMGEVTSVDRRLLIEEIEMEMKSYTEQARSLLRNHESRMSVLLSRLMADSVDN